MSELERADHLLELGRPIDAEQILRAELVQEPESSLALQLLARSLLDQGRTPEALLVAQSAVAAVPAEEQAHRILAIAFLSAGRFPEAVGAAQEATRLAPEFWHGHYLLGAALRANPGTKASRQGLSRALEATRLAPSEAAPHVLASLCLRDLGKNRAADRETAEALRLDPQHFAATQHLAATRLVQGRLTEAVAALTTGLGNDPQHEPLHQLYDRLLTRIVRRLTFAGFVLSAVLSALAIQEASYWARLATAVLGIALCVVGVLLVTRRLPRGSAAWTRGLVKRASILHRLLILLLVAVLVVVLFLGLAPGPAALGAALAYRGLLATYGVVLLIVGMRSVISALDNRI